MHAGRGLHASAEREGSSSPSTPGLSSCSVCCVRTLGAGCLLLCFSFSQFKRQHHGSVFYQKASSVYRFGVRLLFLLFSVSPHHDDLLFSQDGFPSFSFEKGASLLPSLGLLDQTGTSSSSSKGSDKSLPHASSLARLPHLRPAEKSFSCTSTSSSLREKKEEKGRQRKSVFCFTEKILEQTFVLRDSLVDAAAWASQQLHVGFHLNLVLPLLAIYA